MNRLEEKKKSLFRSCGNCRLSFVLDMSDLFIDILDLTGLDRITTRGESYFRFELDFKLDPLSGR